jgi:hypothetical protein
VSESESESSPNWAPQQPLDLLPRLLALGRFSGSLGWPHYHDDCCLFATGTMPLALAGRPGKPGAAGEGTLLRVLCYVDDPDSVARGRTSHSHWQPHGPSPCGLPSHGSHPGLRHCGTQWQWQRAQVTVTLRCGGGSFSFGQMPGWGIGLGFLPPRDRRPAFCPTPLAAKFFARR